MHTSMMAEKNKYLKDKNMEKFNIKEWQDKQKEANQLTEGVLSVIGGLVVGGMVLSFVTKLAANALGKEKFSKEKLTNILNNKTKEIISKSGIDASGVAVFEKEVQQPLQKMIDNGSITSYDEVLSTLTDLVFRLKRKS